MIKRILALLLALTVSALAAETNYFNAAPTVLTNTIITGSISLNGSVITDWPSGSGSQTPWTSNIDGGNFNLSGVNTVSVNNAIFIGDNSVMDLIGSRALTNGTYSLMSVGTATVSQVALSGWPTDWAWSSITNAPAFLTNGWAGAGITIDSANAQTNTYGGALVIGGDRWQASGGTATGLGSWANYEGTASGEGAWANFLGTASGVGSWANYYGAASGVGSWANYGGIASGNGSWAMNPDSVASNDNSFAWAMAHSHGDGSFNIGPPSSFWLDDTNLQTYLDGKLDTNTTLLTVVQGGSNQVITAGGTLTIAASAASGIIPIALLPASALSFGSTNNATIVGTSNGATASNNWDSLEFEPLNNMSAPWQLVNHNASGMTNVTLWTQTPYAGAGTNVVWQFGYANATTGAVMPSAWTVVAAWTNSVDATVVGAVQRLDATFTNVIPVGPVWFNLLRLATDGSDLAPTNAYFIGGRVW